MSALSKHMFKQLAFNCYETLHTWTPHCSHVWMEVFSSVYTSLFPLYVALFSFSHAVKHGKQTQWSSLLSETMVNSNKSAASLAYCFLFLAVFVCNLNRTFGYWSPWMLYIAGFTGCFLGILNERTSRVKLYIVYMLQLVIETMLQLSKDQLQIEGYSIGNGLLLAASISFFTYISRSNQMPRNNFSRWLIMLVGKHSVKRVDENNNIIKNCPHEGTCHHFTLKRAATVFGASSALSILLRIVPAIPVMASKGVSPILSKIFKRSTKPALMLGTALGLFSAVYNGTSCGLRSYFGKDEAWHSIPSSTLASLAAHYFWPSQRIAVYALSNTIHDAYLLGVQQNKLPVHSYGPQLLFSQFCAILLTIGILKPHYVRKSYVKFVDRLLGYRIGDLNWSAVDHLGYGTSYLYQENFKQLLNPENLTKNYLEKMWLWSLDDHALKYFL